MILTLAWKELREHQGVWLTMVVMTIVLGMGLVRIVAPGNSEVSVATAALTILGMAAAYGAVCGSMMFAGEHETGTMVFLDIFWGKRGPLWAGKFFIGLALVIAQGIAVGLILRYLQHAAPRWGLALVGQAGVADLDPSAWLLILPAVAIEAYAWGLLGSSLTKRVLASALVAAVGVTPIWLLAIVAPPDIYFPLRAIGVLILLCFSYYNFLNQPYEGEVKAEAPRTSARRARAAAPDPREQFIELWEAFERDAKYIRPRRPAQDLEHDEEPAKADAPPPAALDIGIGRRAHAFDDAMENSPDQAEAKSATEVLRWLTAEQARPLIRVLFSVIGVGLMIGFLIPANVHGFWPFFSLLLGVVCGVAAFAPEQRDLSSQFLSAQHLPLKTIWRYKIVYWLAVALIAAPVVVIGHSLNVGLRRMPGFAVGLTAGFDGTLRRIMGSAAYFSVWLVYGFCAGQIVVWYCRKNILAVIIALMVAAAGIALWLPSVLCGGMNSWPLAGPPLIMLLAGWCLVRAWASGRILERKPLAAVVGFGMAIVAWALIHFGLRATQIPDVGEPLDIAAFRAGIPMGDANAAGKAINDAAMLFDERNPDWLKSLAEAARLPVGVIEMPRGDDQPPILRHLGACRKMTVELLHDADARTPEIAVERLAQVLAMSRNLRNKAPFESYLAGVVIEDDALLGLDRLLARGQASPKVLRRAFDELNRHVAETPPPLDCLRTESFHSAGVLANPYAWSFSPVGNVNRVPERWVTNGITLSFEAPWEAERKARLWRLVWAGLFRGMEAPYWDLPRAQEDMATTKDVTNRILEDWLPATEGPGAGWSLPSVANLLDASWLADDRLFCSAASLRANGLISQWRVETARQVLALELYQIDNGKRAQKLDDLIPAYFPAGLPTDPYSGQPFRYRIAVDNDPALLLLPARVGDGILWSTGPDRIDHGGQQDASRFRIENTRRKSGGFDFVKVASHRGD